MLQLRPGGYPEDKLGMPLAIVVQGTFCSKADRKAMQSRRQPPLQLSKSKLFCGKRKHLGFARHLSVMSSDCGYLVVSFLPVSSTAGLRRDPPAPMKKMALLGRHFLQSKSVCRPLHTMTDVVSAQNSICPQVVDDDDPNC